MHTSVHSCQHAICTFIALEDILIQHILPASLLHLALEENKKVMIVFIFPKTGFEVRWVGQGLTVCLFGRDKGTLVGCIGAVMFFDDGGRGTETIESKKMVYNVVVEPPFVHEDVVFLGHVLLVV